MRFGVVGVISFVFDWGTLLLVIKYIFGGVETNFSMTIATAVGFMIGVTVNYILSVLFVFKSAKKGAGKNAKSAIVFLLTSAIGLVINQIIMNIGAINLGYNTTLVKLVATFVAMIWNYLSRKFLIFK